MQQSDVPFFSAKEFNALPLSKREQIIRDVNAALGPETPLERAILDEKAASLGREGSYSRLLERGLKTGQEIFERALRESSGRSSQTAGPIPETMPLGAPLRERPLSRTLMPEHPTTPVDTMRHLEATRIALRGDQVQALDALVSGRVDRIAGAQADYRARLAEQRMVDSERRASRQISDRVGPGGFFDIDRGHGMSVPPEALRLVQSRT
jgi:hypothetical protein